MDEKNLDREQYTGLMNTALTNRANTANLNTLYPYYNIDPTQGGIIEMTGDLPSIVANKSAGNQLNKYDEMSQRALDLEAKGLDGSTINTILQNTYGKAPKVADNTGADPYADALRMIRESGMPAGYPGGRKANKGKEIKEYAIPFYAGKTGF
jgi:hypothetical protein